MAKESLEERLHRIFQSVRKEFNYPRLSTPQIKDEMFSIAKIKYDGNSHQIYIQKTFIEKVNDACLEGIIVHLLSHEVDHHCTHPYEVKRVLLELVYLEKYQNRDKIRGLFDDYVVEIDLVKNKNMLYGAEAARIFGRKKEPAIRLMLAYLTEITGLDYGVKLWDNWDGQDDLRRMQKEGVEKEKIVESLTTKYGYGAEEVEEKILDEKLMEKLMLLKQLNFIDLKNLEYNIKRFAAIMQDVELPKQYPVITIFDFGASELEKALIKIAKDLSPDEYKEMLGILTEEINKNAGIGPGYKKIIEKLDDPDIAYYEALAENYHIKIKGLPLRADGGLYPVALTDFSLDDNIEDWDPVNSYGKLIPGLAKKFVKGEFETFGKREKVPNALIIIDSSGSMENPDKFSYAVLAGFCVAKGYLKNIAMVGVLNYSDTNLSLLPTNNRIDILKSIRRYQGGGTTLHLDDLANYLNQLKELTDIILISDGGLHNISEFSDYLGRDIINKHRVTFVWKYSGGSEFVNNVKVLRERYRNKISFHTVMCDSDIPKIAVGELNKVF